jgi:hypothetical protein
MEGWPLNNLLESVFNQQDGLCAGVAERLDAMLVRGLDLSAPCALYGMPDRLEDHNRVRTAPTGAPTNTGRSARPARRHRAPPGA